MEVKFRALDVYYFGILEMDEKKVCLGPNSFDF